jgi:hypothetical protein
VVDRNVVQRARFDPNLAKVRRNPLVPFRSPTHPDSPAFQRGIPSSIAGHLFDQAEDLALGDGNLTANLYGLQLTFLYQVRQHVRVQIYFCASSREMNVSDSAIVAHLALRLIA